MDKSINLIYLFLILITISCSSQEFETELTIYNKSGKVLDSIVMHDVFDKEVTYRNIKNDTNITVRYKKEWSEVPRGERGVFSIVVFDKGQYYWDSTGFIGFPGTTIEDKYELYIYPEYISDEKDFYPDRRSDKKKISEYNSGD